MRYTTSYTKPTTIEDKAPEIRIFISSTFRDMQDEREYLIKHIFPELRSLCRERGVEFTEIDLRWGVTEEEAQQGKVVKICLDEIDRCRPYFIGLLGDRYGWVPSPEDVAKDTALIDEFPWILQAADDGISVTEMEMVYGVLDNPEFAKHSYFYTRDHSITKVEFQDTQETAINKQNDLKNRIRSSGFPMRENYTSIQQLGEMVRKDLLNVLEEDFPIADAPSPIEQERRVHESYALTRRRAYIPRKENISTLDSYTKLDSQPLIITGESGAGKSSLVAFWINDFKKRHPDSFIITHFIGAGSPRSGHIGIIQRVMEEIKERYNLPDDIPTTPESIEKDFVNWLAKVQKEQLILVLDSLDRLPAESRHLRWMPNYFPPNVCGFFSVAHGETLEVIEEKGFPKLEVQPLNESERDSLIVAYLGQFRKALSFDQRLSIIEDHKSANPLFLRTLLEELRIFGSFEELNNKIAHYISSKDTSDLFQRVLERMERDYGKDGLENLLSLIWASRHGLSETELMEISGLTRLELSILLHSLEYQLMRHDGLLDFYHQYLERAVDERYLSGESEREKEKLQHLRIADFFEKQDTTIRKANELPWQLQITNETQRLRNCLKDIPMFLEFAPEEKHYELLGYWRSVGDLSIMEQDYIDACKKFSDSQKESMMIADINNSLSNFFILNSRYKTAQVFSEKAVSILESNQNTSDIKTAEAIFNLGRIFHFQGEYEKAYPQYIRSMEIREKVSNSTDHEYARTVSHLARLSQERGDLDTSENLYRRALELLSNTVGLEHSTTAKTLNNFAILLREKGKFLESEDYFTQAVNIGKKCLGAEHPYTNDFEMNLGQLFHIVGKLDKARVIFEDVVHTYEKVFGREHPETAYALDNLAVLFRDIGDYEKSYQLYQETLAIWQNLVGNSHINTATTLNNLGEVLMDLGKFEESEAHYTRSYEIFTNLIGKEHPYTSHPIHGIGLVNRKKGDYSRAAEFFKQAYDIREKAFGAHHETLEALNDYISVVEKLDNPELLQQLTKRKGEIENKSLSES
jgi:nephrocystin-3